MTSSAPDDLFFREIVSSYLQTPRFLRREWLAEELEARLAEPACRFVLLTAAPGAGKSAFTAQLASLHPDWPVFFIRRDQRIAMGEVGSRSFLLRIGFQLAAMHPELFELDQVRIEVEQRIGTAEDHSEVVGAEISRIRASPFHQTVVRIKQTIQQTGGSVAGLRIGEYIPDPRLIDQEDLQEMALFGPARVLRRLKPDERIVVLVDALDELRYHEHEQNLLDWLANCPPLPENVRMVLTSRPSRGPLVTFMEKRKDSLALLPIEASDDRVQGDIRTYAVALLEPGEVGAALVDTGQTREGFLTELIVKADGNIGYLAALGRAFDQALARQECRSLLKDLLGLKRLPDDIEGLFAFFLHLIQHGPGRKDVKVTDPKTGRAGLVEAWSEVFHPVLALLAVALEPLTLDEIHALTGTLAGRAQLVQAMGWLDQFLERIGNTYRLYHGTLAEFLTARTTSTKAETSDLYVDPDREHLRLANILEGEDWPDAIWQDCTNLQEQSRRDYARVHYITHLYLGGDWNRLRRTIDEVRYGQGKLRFDRSTFLYSRDVDLAIQTITEEEVGETPRLEHLSRLWRYAMLRCSLTSDADNYEQAAFVALCLLDRVDEAEGLVQLLSSAERQALVSVAMGEALASAGVPDRARPLLLRACTIAHELADASARELVVEQILSSCRAVEPLGFRDASVAERVFELTWFNTNNGGNPELLAAAIWYFNRSGAKPTFFMQHLSAIDRSLVEPARQRARQPESVTTGIQELAAISRIERLLGRIDGARGTLQTATAAARAGNPDELIEGLITVARELAALGDRQEALSLLREAAAEHSLRSAGADKRGRLPGKELYLGAAFAEAGDWRSAISIADSMHVGWGNPMAAAVQELCRQSQWDQALQVAVDRAKREQEALGTTGLVEVVKRGERRNRAVDSFLTIVRSLAACGEIERATDVARGLESCEARCDALAIIAAGCARRGLAGSAKALLSEQNNILRGNEALQRRSRLWPLLMDLFATAHAFDEARQAAARAGSGRVTRDCMDRIAMALAERGRVTEALDIIEKLEGTRVNIVLAVLAIHTGEDKADFESASSRGLRLLLEESAAGRYYDVLGSGSSEEAEMRAALLKAIADLLIRRGELERAAQFLFQACEELNRVRRFTFLPSPWSDMPAAFARAGRLPTALRLMNQFAGPYDRVCGLEEFAGVAHETGRPDVAKNMLVDAFDTASRSDPRWRSSLQSRTAAKAIQLGMLELLDSFLQKIRPKDEEARGQIAVALADRAEIDRARRLLAALPRTGVPRGASNPLSGPYSRLVIAMLKAGNLEGAEALLPEVTDNCDRVRVNSELAAALLSADRSSDAVNALMLAGELWETDSTAWHRDAELREIATRLEKAADVRTRIGQVHTRWDNAITWEELARAFSWAHAVVSLRPTLASEIVLGFDWVESALTLSDSS